MFVKLLFKNLNPVSYLPPPISTYTNKVTTAPKVRDEKKKKKTFNLRLNVYFSLTNR